MRTDRIVNEAPTADMVGAYSIIYFAVNIVV